MNNPTIQYKYIHKQTIGRYEQVVPPTTPARSTRGARGVPMVSNKHSDCDFDDFNRYYKASLNHMQFWAKLDKVIIHSTSKQLLTNLEYYSQLCLAVHCITAQTPAWIKTKQSIAAFKMAQGSVIGVASHLRKDKLINFSYKWTFLAPSTMDLIGTKYSTAIGINNVLIFELSQYDYASFEHIPGIELQFVKHT